MLNKGPKNTVMRTENGRGMFSVYTGRVGVISRKTRGIFGFFCFDFMTSDIKFIITLMKLVNITEGPVLKMQCGLLIG